MAGIYTQFLKYTLLPGFIPRAYDLFASGFVHVPYLIAILYQACGLLPPSHAYLNPRNIGKFGVHHVIAEAANNLVFSRKNADQIAIFFIILIGAALLFAQFLLLALTIFTDNPVLAGTPGVASPVSYSYKDILDVTSTYNHKTDQDMALMLLDLIFGTPGIFNSCVSLGTACLNHNGLPLPNTWGAFPTSFHKSLHLLLEFYSNGLFIVAMIIILYFIVTITAETAATGTPFGERANKPWAMMRLIVFFALLVPMNVGAPSTRNGHTTEVGLNMGQIITLWSAKLGSNFATNAWGRFNQELGGPSYLGQTQSLVGLPSPPPLNELVKFMFLAKTCQVSENHAYGHLPNGIQAYLVRERQLTYTALPGPDFLDLNTTNYATALQFNRYGNIIIAFGVQDADNDDKGSVKPLCGSVTIPVTSADPRGAATPSGAANLQDLYYNIVKEMWQNDTALAQNAACVRARISEDDQNPTCTPWPNQAFIEGRVDYYQNKLETSLKGMVATQINTGNFTVSSALVNKGWAGAAIWYNRLAELNGNVATAVFSTPEATLYPYVMEYVANQRRTNNEAVSTEDIFDPDLKGEKLIEFKREKDLTIAMILNKANAFWQESAAGKESQLQPSLNPVIDSIAAIFGVQGIFQVRCNTTIHPLAQLTMLGKGMMYAAIRNFTIGAGLSLGHGTVSEMFGAFVGNLAHVAADFTNTIALATMSMSFILAYVLPFMPFLFFMFALAGWLKAIFEAMIAMPLWALAHITHIDGQGLPGQFAKNGYFLILEIFLRPILILFGLLAALQIYAAMISVMNQIFDLVTANVGGFAYKTEITATCVDGTYAPALSSSARGAVDKFFYTFVYVILCYMMAMGSFKLIDFVPNTILRWAGVIARPMVERPDTASGLVSTLYRGSTLATQNIKGGALAALLAK